MTNAEEYIKLQGLASFDLLHLGFVSLSFVALLNRSCLIGMVLLPKLLVEVLVLLFLSLSWLLGLLAALLQTREPLDSLGI